MPGYFFCEKQTQLALKINLSLAWRYHRKFQHIPKEEFVSIGLVAIAVCLNAWKKKRRSKEENFGGFAKICIQNAYRDYLRKNRKEYQLYLTITRVSTIFRYTSIRSTEQEDNFALPGSFR